MERTMLAAVFAAPGQLRLEERPVPAVRAPDDVLLEVEGAGICGTDLHILEVPPGHPATVGAILGHEYVGRVVEAGPAVADCRPGDRVVVAPNLACGCCEACLAGRPNHCAHFTTLGIYLDGGFARYNVAPRRALHRISADLPAEEAVFVELLSCVVGGTARTALEPGEDVAILGAGPVGLVFALVLRGMGAGRIFVADLVPLRLEAAARIGCEPIDARQGSPVAQIRERTGGRGVEVVVDAVGSLADQAIDLAAVGGRVVLFGMNDRARPAVHQYDVTRRELTILGTFIGVNTFPKAIRMLERGVVRPSALLSAAMPLSEAPAAFDLLRRGEAIKIMLRP
ncbi:MAG: alcohol dehydrogenase catalytic domain-containing protein [Anaerolineae bacterium]|nr:alcohol dehydrogenase catalytic domain-containing protein [Anaerolineae bacterium]